MLSIWEDKTQTGQTDGPKQLVFLIIGVVCTALFQVVNYQKIGRFAWVFYFFSLALIGYTVIGAIKGGKAPIPLVRKTGRGVCMDLHQQLFHPTCRTDEDRVHHGAGAVSSIPIQLSHIHRPAPAVRTGGRSTLVDSQAARSGHCPHLHPRTFRDALRRRAKCHLLAIVGMGLMLAPILWFSGTCPKEGCACSAPSRALSLPTVREALSTRAGVRSLAMKHRFNR